MAKSEGGSVLIRKTMEQNSEEKSNIETVSYKKIVSKNILFCVTKYFRRKFGLDDKLVFKMIPI